jgi:predicted alpha-1,6-mannanase (GH76 family)
MNLRRSRELAKLIAAGTTAAAVILSTGPAASAFTAADVNIAANSYISAFVQVSGPRAFIKANQNGGDPGFWQEIEQVEGIEDANDRANGAYKAQVAEVLNGFIHAHGSNWSWNGFNDDISWATIAYVRGYQATGNTTFLSVAKDNFDMMFNRAYDPTEDALYWTTDNRSYNSCIECPAGIASCLLSQALGDPSYLKKAQALFDWEKANLFNSSTGAVYDSVNLDGNVSNWSSSYNQGTFVGLANALGDTASGELAADYTMTSMGNLTVGGHRILPEYGAGSGNNSGFNSICVRWISRFMKDRGLQKIYLPWLQANADAAWNLRRSSDDLSWCQWFHQTPTGVLNSWDCVSSMAALQDTPPDDPPIKQ